MRLAFAGTPAFAVVVLSALLDTEHSIEAVFTQPDARAGRGRRMTESVVKQYAAAINTTVHQPRTLHSPEVAATLAELDLDALVVAAYGLLLPAPILAIPRHGCINVHASLLPRWRGAAPAHHAILAGDSVTGVSIMQMETGLDTGPILAARICAITADDTAGSLTARLAELGATTLIETLPAIASATVTPRRQDAARATTAAGLSKSRAAIDWTDPAPAIERKIRALNPWPVAYTGPTGTNKPAFRIWRAMLADGDATQAPGTVLRCDAGGLVVTAAGGAINITEIQPPGGRRMATAEFVRGHRIDPGTRLGGN